MLIPPQYFQSCWKNCTLCTVENIPVSPCRSAVSGVCPKTHMGQGFQPGEIVLGLLSNGWTVASNPQARGVKPVRPKILIAVGLAAAFLFGAMANGIYTATTRAFSPVEENSIATVRNPQPVAAVSRTHFAQPVTRTRAVQPKTVYVSEPAPEPVVYRESQKKRSFGKEALIVGGSAGAGAAVGAVAGGKKGAAIGAVSGGVAGLVYDLVTRNK
jgi:hypothetical protein